MFALFCPKSLADTLRKRCNAHVRAGYGGKMEIGHDGSLRLRLFVEGGGLSDRAESVVRMDLHALPRVD